MAQAEGVLRRPARRRRAIYATILVDWYGVGGGVGGGGIVGGGGVGGVGGVGVVVGGVGGVGVGGGVTT